MELINKKGLVKVDWVTAREYVAKVDVRFAKLVDDLDLDNSFALYLAFYPYGSVIADPLHMYVPKNKNETCSLLDLDASNSAVKDLAYGKDSLAMGMVLEKNLEVFIDLKEERSTIPWLIYKPGTFFPFSKTLSNHSSRTYAPNNILTIVSGARSVFMLPNIGCLTNHINLQKNYHIQSSSPKSIYEHGQVFKEIVNSDAVNTDWRSCLLYFSEKWMNYLHADPAWVHLKLYLHELAWHHFEHRRNHIYYDIAFSKIQKKRNLKPNPYLTDTAMHLFATALGAAPGFAPACDNDFLPLDLLQQAYIESYGMRKYHPTIMQPTIFHFEKDRFPVYYSLQNPSTFVCSPRSRKLSSTLFDMNELEYIMRIFQEELTKENAICSGTIISEMTQKIEFAYYHNELDKHRIIKSSVDIFAEDQRYHFVSDEYKVQDAGFATDAKFLRGCIRIKARML